MTGLEIEFQREKLFMERLYKQLQTVEEFRFKLTLTKIAFITGLLGIGTVKLSTDVNLSPTLLLAPFVAVLFDSLGMAATVAIKRIDAFLRVSCVPDERKWQNFLKQPHLCACEKRTFTQFLRSLILIPS